MNKPFDLEAFKAGQKALTRLGNIVEYVGFCSKCTEGNRLIGYVNCGNVWVSRYYENGRHNKDHESEFDLVSMVSRHQALIDSYNPEDTWQCKAEGLEWVTLNTDLHPSFDDKYEWRLHPHNDLIKAWKKGAKIEAYIVGDWVEEPNPDWYEDTQYRIKPESEFVYPLYKQSLLSRMIVRFTDKTEGEVVNRGSNHQYLTGDIVHDLFPHTNTDHWQDWNPPEPVIHCLAYNLNDNYHLITPYVMTIEKAQKYGYKIIQEWEV